jgi:hypothetical protein
MPDRLPPERYHQLYDLLCQSGVSVCHDRHSYESMDRLREMRALYEGYAQALSDYLRMPLPPWISEHPHKDNWKAVARLRARTEAASAPAEATDLSFPASVLPPAAPAGVVDAAQAIARLVDDHHDF